MRINLKQNEVWFVTGSLDLYGEAALQRVSEQAASIATALDSAPGIPVRVVMGPVVKSPESIRKVLMEANAAEK